MSVKTAIASAVRELPKPDITLPLAWPIFGGSPNSFKAEVHACLSSLLLDGMGLRYGYQPLLGRLSDVKQDDSHRGFRFSDRQGNEMWIVCVSQPVRPGETSSQTSLITVHMENGRLTPELAQAASGIKDYLAPWFVTK